MKTVILNMELAVHVEVPEDVNEYELTNWWYFDNEDTVALSVDEFAPIHRSFSTELVSSMVVETYHEEG